MSTIDEILEKIKEDAKERFEDKYEILGIIEHKEVEFNDASLDLSDEGDFAAQVMTPGYKILLDALERATNDRLNMLYHTDRISYNIRYNPDPDSY